MPQRFRYFIYTLLLAYSLLGSPLISQGSLIDRRYDKWIENILSDGVWQPWQAEKDERYRAFQRDLFLSESLLDKGYLAEGLSYIKKASFSLEDIHQSLRRIHSWPKNLESDFNNGDSDEEKRAKALRINHKIHAIHLYLQFEQYYFHSQPFSTEQSSYLRKAQALYANLSTSQIKSKIDKSYLSQYLNKLKAYHGAENSFEKIINQEIITFGLSEKYANDYWYNKLIKRVIFVATAWGYAEKAISLLENLQKRRSFDLPTISKYQIYLSAGESRKARSVLLKEIFSFDLSRPFLWPEYLKLKIYYIQSLLVEEDYNQAMAKAEALIIEINAHMRKNLVAKDQEEFLKERKLVLLTLVQALKHSLNLPPGKVKMNLNNWPSQYAKSLTRYFILQAMLEKRNVVNKNILASSRTLGQQYQIIEAARGRKKKNLAKSLTALEAQDNHYATSSSALLKYTLGEDTSLKSWQQAYKSFLLLSSFSFSLDTLPITEFDLAALEKVLETSKSPRIFSMLAFAHLWPTLLHNRDAFLSSSLNRVRYLNLVHNNFVRPIVNIEPLYTWFDKQFRADVSLLKPNCQSNRDACLYIYPGSNKTTIVLQGNGKLRSFSISKNNADLKNLSIIFYQSFEKRADKKPDLGPLNQAFARVLTELDKSSFTTLSLFAYKNASFIPFEALNLNSKQRFADKFLVKRKLQTDFVLSSKKKKDLEKKKLFFIGVGKRGGGFLGLSSAQDELDDIEGVFAHKKIIRSDSEYLNDFLHALNKATNTVCHFASEFIPDKNQNGEAYLRLGESSGQMHLNQLSKAKNLPRIIISKQRILPFLNSKSLHFKRMLNAFQTKGTKILILTMVETPKKFRSAFYYDFYYRLERKKLGPFEAYQGALARTKKGFARDLWPYLMTIYEP